MCFMALKEFYGEKTLLIRGYPETTRREQSVGVSSVYETGIGQVVSSPLILRHTLPSC